MTCNVTLSLKGWTIWQDCYCGSRLTCIVKTYSPCLSSHDDVNTFQFQQATIFTATLLFQPQLITTLYIQLLFYTHAHRHYFIHDSREMQEIFRRAHNNKRQYFIEPFLIRSVRCKREHFWWWFLSSPPVLSCLTTAVVIFLSGSGSRYAIKFLIWGCITSNLASNITTRWYFKLLM